MARQYYYQRHVCCSWMKVLSDVSVADSRSRRVLCSRNVGLLQYSLLSGLSKLSRTCRAGGSHLAASRRRRRNGNWRCSLTRFRSSIRCQRFRSRTADISASGRRPGLFERPIQRSTIRCGGKCNGSHLLVAAERNAVFQTAR